MSIDKLIAKYLEGNISTIERSQLKNWVFKNSDNLKYFKSSILDHYKYSPLEFNSNNAFVDFYDKTKKKNKRSNYLRIAAGFSILIGITIYFSLSNPFSNNSQDQIVEEIDKYPGKTSIILSDGSKHILEDSKKSTIQIDDFGNMTVEESNQLLTSNSSKDDQLNFQPIKIIVPNGKKLKLKLSDGTFVWLNSRSVLEFSQRFKSDVDFRLVKLSGEAYFDVAKNKDQPFLVRTNDYDVKVIGTKFNVSSYNSDHRSKTTLVEGKVEIYNSDYLDKPLKINPDEQFVLDKNKNSINKKNVDVAIHTGWIEGKLIVDKMKLSEIFIKLERRYDVEIINKAEGLSNDTYNGKFDEENLRDILKTISLTAEFTYDIRNNKVIITNKNQYD